jgi:hypothetical protein
VISDEEKLRPCMNAYDTKVAGVLSGAGDCRSGKPRQNSRVLCHAQ